MLLPADARADTSAFDTVPARFRVPVEFSLPSGSGDKVQVAAIGRTAVLAVSRGAISAWYKTRRARVSSGGLKARFGRFGRIAVRFQPSGKIETEEPPRRCKGKPHTVRAGVYVGFIRFRGERGFVQVDTDRAQGTSVSAPKWRCKKRLRGSQRILSRATRLEAPVHRFLRQDEAVVLDASSPKGRIIFSAANFPVAGEGRFTTVDAGVFSWRPQLLIYHSAYLLSKESHMFQFDDELTTATVDPPRPFRGSATLQGNPDGSSSWLGSLRVYLPGVGDIALSGPRYEAKLRRDTGSAWFVAFADPPR